MTITSQDLPAILERHRKWMDGDPSGERANLQGANLQGAYLRGAYLTDANLTDAYLTDAYLTDANLRGANLAGAYLTGAYLTDGEKITATASIQFTGHGECGRALVAIRSEKRTILWCGCFHGTPDDLRAYIDSGNDRLKRTKTLALDTVLALLDAKNDEE